ncbi:hypothetical protein KL949_003897 [Ogataea haglerorum]|nr:hypothetical protein KL913_003643 [Ogataea haglerorum]KAG7716606.1 hypothetical protein KL949_003897 [Ogataea haglerorum]
MTQSFDIVDILSKLKLEEKLSLLSLKDFWHTVNIERLGIPSIRLSDGPNGVRGTKWFLATPTACFSSGTAMASSFNQDLLYEIGALMALEAKHKGVSLILGPTSNINRGPLGGRGFESFSEDPYLSGVMATSIINGIQSLGIGACIKHFICNDLEHERNSIDVMVSERALREIYLFPFQMALQGSKPVSVMSSYNKVNGEHVSQSKKFLARILREEWNFEGAVISDWFGTYTAKESIKAGLDIECPGPPTIRNKQTMLRMIHSGELSMKDIDDRVRNVLKLIQYSMKSGIHENAPEDSKNNVSSTSSLLRKLASESIVLLKNENSFLPFNRSDKLAIIGPNAKHSRAFGGGSAAMKPYYTIGVYEGISSKLGKDIDHATGCRIDKQLDDLGGNSKFVKCLIYREPPSVKSRKPIEEADIDSTRLIFFGYKHELLESNIFYVTIHGEFVAEEAGDYVFKSSCLGTSMLYINGEVLIDDRSNQKLSSGTLGASSVGGEQVLSLQKGESLQYTIEFSSSPTFTLETDDLVGLNGGGLLNVTVQCQRSDRELMCEAVEAAKKADKVILCLGTSAEWESEGFDRHSMSLPGAQEELLSMILEVNTNVVVVNLSGMPVSMNWVSKVPALIQGWINGSESGNAIADVLFGDVNPSGKLSMTFPKKCEDNPTFINFSSNNGMVLYGEDIFVGYRYYEKKGIEPQFPFGFGLSYTTFEITNLQVSTLDGHLVATVRVQNTGFKSGKEVVQLYVAHSDSMVSRAPKELKGFTKVELNPNESKLCRIEISLKLACSYYNIRSKSWTIEPGQYNVFVGNSSNSSSYQTARFTVSEETNWIGL